jgi:hypothetical protein
MTTPSRRLIRRSGGVGQHGGGTALLRHRLATVVKANSYRLDLTVAFNPQSLRARIAPDV